MSTVSVSRNPNIAKWDILFDKKTAEWISFKPQLGLQVYPCYACRAMFGSKNSFLDHVNRRGMVLKYKCSFCKCTSFFEFYNPCAFLLHTRRHYNLIEGHINLDNLEVQTLPFGLGGFLPDPNIPMIYNVKDDNVGESTFINTRFYNPTPDSKGKPNVTLVPNELLFLFSPGPNIPSMSLVLKQMSANIPRCKFINLDTSRFTPIPEGVDINGKELVNNCNETVQVKQECQEPQNNSNFCIPVITKTESLYESNDENNELPMDSMIDHFPHCPECGEAQIVPMNEHFIKSDKLFEDNLKCGMCKYIAPTKCSLKAHERIHKNKAPYVCPECGKDFDNSQLLYLHLGDVCFHLTKQVRHRCPAKKCGKIFAQLSTFASHFLSHFNKVFSCTLCSDTYFLNEADFLDHSTTHNSTQCVAKRLYVCTVCNDSNKVYNKANSYEHIEWHASDKKQFLYIYVCKHCHSYFRSTTTYATHLLRCSKLLHATVNADAKRKRTLDHMCSICYFCKSTNSEVIYFNGINSKCNNCGEKLIFKYNAINDNDFEVLWKTQPSEDQREYLNCLLCNSNIHFEEIANHYNSNKCKYDNSKIVLDSNVVYADIISLDSSNNKKSKSLSSKSSSFSDTDISIQLEEPVAFEGIYNCKLCVYQNIDRKDFHAHIIHHRDVSTAYQCMECGECFVVKPSLIKHLLFYHEISNIDDYFHENECFDKEAVRELELNMRLTPGESKEPVAENQCRVCRLQCSDSLELNKHFRVHGMAFLLNNSK